MLDVCFFSSQKWRDYRLTWNASEFGGVAKLYVPVSRLWLPDITLWNKYVKRLSFKSTIINQESRNRLWLAAKIKRFTWARIHPRLFQESIDWLGSATKLNFRHPILLPTSFYVTIKWINGWGSQKGKEGTGGKGGTVYGEEWGGRRRSVRWKWWSREGWRRGMRGGERLGDSGKGLCKSKSSFRKPWYWTVANFDADRRPWR